MDLLSPRKRSELSEPLHGRSKKIYVFENGDRFMKCCAPVINPKFLKTWKHILLHLTEKMQPGFGTVENLVNLKTMEKIRSFDDLETEEKYVALGPNSQFVSLKYMTEQEQLKKKRCKKGKFYTGELDASKKYFFEETKKRGLTVIFVVPNGAGGINREPKKFVFSAQDLAIWTQTLVHIAKSLDIDELISLSTIFGDTIEESCQLQHGYLYVAVPYNHEFISCDYAKLFDNWSSPIAFKLKIIPADHKSTVKFNLGAKQVEAPSKELSLVISDNTIEQSQSILKLNESKVEESLVLPDINVTLLKDAVENRTKTLKDSSVILRSNSSKELMPGMLAHPHHLNECAPNMCEVCDSNGTECPDCTGKCDTNVAQKDFSKPCPGECTAPCTEHLICCPVCSCIIKIPDQRKKKAKCSKSCNNFQIRMECCNMCECDGFKHVTERKSTDATEGTQHSADSEAFEVHPSSEYSEKQEASCLEQRNSNSGAKIPSQEPTKDPCSEDCPSKNGTSCIECKCGSPNETTEPDTHQCKDPILGEETYAAPNTVEEPVQIHVTVTEEHETSCLICEYAQKNNEFKKTLSLRKSTPSPHSEEQSCDENCQQFRQTGIQYPVCRCDEVDNILPLVIVEAQTVVEHCEREDCIENKGSSKTVCKDSKASRARSTNKGSKNGSKDSRDLSPKQSKQTKSKGKQKKMTASSNEARSSNGLKSPPKTKRKKSKQEHDNLIASSSKKAESFHIPDKKTKTSPSYAPVKKKNGLAKDKKSKESMSLDSLEVVEGPKNRLDHNTKRGRKNDKSKSPGTKNDIRSCKPGECSSNTESFKISIECKAVKFSDRNTSALGCAKRSEITTKCASMKTLDPISESCSDTTNTTSEAEVECGYSEEVPIKLEKSRTTACASDEKSNTGGTTGFSKIYEAPSSYLVKEEIIQKLAQIAVEIENQHANMKGGSESCDNDEKKVEERSKKTESSCSLSHDGEVHVEQPIETATPTNSPRSSASSVAVNVEDNFEVHVEENVGESKPCDGCLWMTCQCGGRFGEFCDCDSSADKHIDEPMKYILICDSHCDILRKTGALCPVCECDSCRENEDLGSSHVKLTCERSVEADLREVPAIDQDIQVGESCVYTDHEQHSVEFCYEEVLSDISEDSLESCCMLKAVKEDIRLVKKGGRLSVEDVYKASKDKKGRHKESCYFFPNEGCLQGISIKNKMDVNFYGTSGVKQHGWHYSKTKKYKRCESSNFMFVNENSTAESERISSKGDVNYSHNQNRGNKCTENDNSSYKGH